jgi:hypothetical protein
MKKDKYGTITTASRKAPHGYGLCAACSHPNVHLNERGQLAEHGSVELRGRCPGSLEAPANVGGKNVFLLITQQAADRGQPIYAERFCFLAPSVSAAHDDGRLWMRYHGMDPRDVLVRLVPPGQATGEDLHDDWIPR